MERNFFVMNPLVDRALTIGRAAHRDDGAAAPGGRKQAGTELERRYCRARKVTPNRRGSLGVPRIRPELPAWIVRFWI